MRVLVGDFWSQYHLSSAHINSLRLSASVNYAIIDSDNGLSPVWHQAIIWTNAG